MSLLFSMLLVASVAPDGLQKSSKHSKVLIIGVDGVSLNLLEPFAAAGVVPHMARLLDEGARGDLASIWPLRTPQVWTSAVTGKYPGQHGIWDHLSNTYFNPPEFRTKKKKRITTEHRKSKALWNMLAEHGHSTVSVGWMATWPAETVDGATIVAPVELMGDRRQTTIKGSFYRDARRFVQPAHHLEEVRKRITEASDLSAEDIAPFADLPGPKSPLLKLPSLKRYNYALKWSLARAKSVEAITAHLHEREQPDVLLTYYQCTDSLLHRFWIFQMGEERMRARLKQHKLSPNYAGELVRRYSRVVEQCYRDVDARIGRLLEQAAGPDTLVLLISDHGFGDSLEPHLIRGEPYGGNHLDDGIILARGPGIAARSRIEGVSILDITPTVLHYMGLPVGDDMAGKVIPALVGNKASKPVATVPTWEAKPQLKIPYREGYPKKGVTHRSHIK